MTNDAANSAAKNSAIAVGKKIGVNSVNRHIFLCADQTKAKCCSLEAGMIDTDLCTSFTYLIIKNEYQRQNVCTSSLNTIDSLNWKFVLHISAKNYIVAIDHPYVQIYDL
jgi:hypothetical protein